jgi:molybdopterin-binding protein
MPDDGSALSAFEGYALTQYNGENASYSLIATPICANKTINLTKTSNGMNGDNLFVNSYLAPIDLTKFTDDDFSGNFEKTFYLFNSGSWDDWQNNGGNVNNGFTSGDARGQYFAITPLSVKLLDTNIEQTVIPSMQGVYVIANENGASIKLDYNKHVYKAEAANMHHHMRAPEITDRDFMRVRMQVGSMNSGADRLYVIQYKEGTSGFDNGYDARNILAEGQANIYTSEQDGEMEISVSDKVDGTYIGFAAGGDSEYVLRLASVVGELYLKDLETETVWAVMDGEEYTFYATPNTKNDRRFLLLDHKPEQSGGVSTGVENVHSTKAWIADNVVYVTNAPINTELVVYTMSGTVVTSFVTTTTYATIDLNMPTGVYMLRLNNKVYKFVCK